MLTKKMGRPIIGEAKTFSVTVRIPELSLKALDDYCSKNGITRVEGIRLAIDKTYRK